MKPYYASIDHLMLLDQLAISIPRSEQNQLPEIIVNIKFADGIEFVRSQAQAAAA